MASLEEIYKEITDAFIEDDTVIAKYGLDTTKTFDEQFSKFAIERIIFYTVAFVIYVREKSLDKWLKEVEATALATRYGTKQWWHKTALAWQKDDFVMLLLDGSVGYINIDESKQIVKYAAVVSQGRTVYIKVAKKKDDSLEPLTSEELTSFSSYIDKVKPVGINVVAQSMKGCGLQINGTVYYNGEKNPDTVLQDVYSAVREYLPTIEFGGVLFKNKIIDVIQGVEGVSDATINVLITEHDGSHLWLGRCYTAKGGYYKTNAWGLKAEKETDNN